MTPTVYSQRVTRNLGGEGTELALSDRSKVHLSISVYQWVAILPGISIKNKLYILCLVSDNAYAMLKGNLYNWKISRQAGRGITFVSSCLLKGVCPKRKEFALFF